MCICDQSYIVGCGQIFIKKTFQRSIPLHSHLTFSTNSRKFYHFSQTYIDNYIYKIYREIPHIIIIRENSILIQFNQFSSLNPTEHSLEPSKKKKKKNTFFFGLFHKEKCCERSVVQ